jgi:hypothetical protein
VFSVDGTSLAELTGPVAPSASSEADAAVDSEQTGEQRADGQRVGGDLHQEARGRSER